MPSLPTGDRRLTGDPQFIRYWLSEAVSDLGASIAPLALSLTAVVVLSAGAFEMGVLAAAANLPHLGIGLLAGVIVDRIRRRPVLVTAALVSAGILLLVPIASLAGVLRIEVLYVVAFGTGAAAVVATVAYRAFLPVLAGRTRLVEANSLLQMSSSAAEIGGKALGGLLIQVVTAPLAFVVTAATSLVSAALLLRVDVAEPDPTPPESGRSMLREMREGMRIVLTDPILRPVVLTGATHNFFSNGMVMAIYVLFASETLGVSPAAVGLVFAAGGPGAMVGAMLAGRLARRFGLGPVLGAVQILTGAARVAIPLAAWIGPAVLVLAAGELALGAIRAVFNVNQISLRQAVTPDHLLGRTTASIGFLMWGAVPFGALLGGWLGMAVGLLPTLAIGIAGTFAASLWIYVSPVRFLRVPPAIMPPGERGR